MEIFIADQFIQPFAGYGGGDYGMVFLIADEGGLRMKGITDKRNYG